MLFVAIEKPGHLIIPIQGNLLGLLGLHGPIANASWLIQSQLRWYVAPLSSVYTVFPPSTAWHHTPLHHTTLHCIPLHPSHQSPTSNHIHSQPCQHEITALLKNLLKIPEIQQAASKKLSHINANKYVANNFISEYYTRTQLGSCNRLWLVLRYQAFKISFSCIINQMVWFILQIQDTYVSMD